MFAYIARRVLYSIPVLLVSSFLLFCATRIAFDPTARFRVTVRDPEAFRRIEERLGLDKSLPEQYWIWLKGVVQGDFGVSSRTSGEVWPMMTRALGSTAQVIFWGMLFAAVVSICIGVYSSVRQYSPGDYLFTGLSYIGIAMPPFWFGLLAIQFFAITIPQTFNLDEPIFFFIGFHKVGESGINMDYFRHLALPVLTLCIQIIGSWSRYERTAMLDVLSSDYVRTARAKGLSRRKVVFKHAFRNALIPLITVMAIDSGGLFGGLIITEYIFSISGMGRLFFDSLLVGDVYVVMAWLLVVATIVVLFNLIADISYSLLDPRIRLS